jgi:hypothetical protein
MQLELLECRPVVPVSLTPAFISRNSALAFAFQSACYATSAWEMFDGITLDALPSQILKDDMNTYHGRRCSR